MNESLLLTLVVGMSLKSRSYHELDLTAFLLNRILNFQEKDGLELITYSKSKNGSVFCSKHFKMCYGFFNKIL